MTAQSKDSTRGDEQADQLGDAIAGEEKALRGAPSLTEDGPGVHRDTDAGPTAATMLTASQILEAEELTPRLQSLEAAADRDRP